MPRRQKGKTPYAPKPHNNNPAGYWSAVFSHKSQPSQRQNTLSPNCTTIRRPDIGRPYSPTSPSRHKGATPYAPKPHNENMAGYRTAVFSRNAKTSQGQNALRSKTPQQSHGRISVGRILPRCPDATKAKRPTLPNRTTITRPDIGGPCSPVFAKA